MTGPDLDQLAQYIAAQGWRPVWIRRNSEAKLVPLTGTTGRGRVDLPRPPDAVTLAVGCPDGAAMFDVDQYEKKGVAKNGADRLRAMEAELGTLPPTHRITCRGASDPGGKLLFRVPPDLVLRGDITKHVESVQRHLRWTWAPGTLHPEHLAPVEVFGPDGAPCYLPRADEVPWLPVAWQDGCRADDRAMTRGGASLPDDDGRCRRVLAWLEDTAGLEGSTSARGDTANRAVNYLKRTDAEGCHVGGCIDEVITRLPYTSEADFADMWTAAPVPADIVPLFRECCHPWVLPSGRSMDEVMAERMARAAANGNGSNPAAMLAAPPVPDGYGGIDAIYTHWHCETKWLNPDLEHLRPYLEAREAAEQAPAAPAPLLARMKSGAYLNGAEFPPLHYHIDGLVPEGLTVLSGAPKIGKSWLVLKWLLELAKAGHVVLYLALEDSSRRMQWRCRKFLGGEQIPETFFYMTEEDVVPGMLMGTIAEFVAGTGDRKPLIVVDTLAKALQQVPRVRDEPAYERDYRVTAALQALVRDCPGAGLVICHHDRKASGGDWMDKASGTKGITGGPDAVMFLERERAGDAGALHVSGKDIAENDYAMTFAGGYRWEFGGGTLANAAAAYLTRRAQGGLGDRSAQIVALAHECGAEGVNRDDVAGKTGMTPNAASEYLTRLHGSGRLQRAARGLYRCVCCVCSPPVTTPPQAGIPIQHTQHTRPHDGPAAPRSGVSPPGQPGPPAGFAPPPGMSAENTALLADLLAGHDERQHQRDGG